MEKIIFRDSDGRLDIVSLTSSQSSYRGAADGNAMLTLPPPPSPRPTPPTVAAGRGASGASSPLRAGPGASPAGAGARPRPAAGVGVPAAGPSAGALSAGGASRGGHTPLAGADAGGGGPAGALQRLPALQVVRDVRSDPGEGTARHGGGLQGRRSAKFVHMYGIGMATETEFPLIVFLDSFLVLGV